MSAPSIELWEIKTFEVEVTDYEGDKQRYIVEAKMSNNPSFSARLFREQLLRYLMSGITKSESGGWKAVRLDGGE